MGNLLGKKNALLVHPLGYELMLKSDQLENLERSSSSTYSAEAEQQPHRCGGGGGGGGGGSVRIKVRMTVRELKELMAKVDDRRKANTEIGSLILEECLKGRWVGSVISGHVVSTEYAKGRYQLDTIMEESSNFSYF